MPPHENSHYVGQEDITQEEHAKIAELRKAIGPEILKMVPFFDNDFGLLRWLYGWDFKIPATALHALKVAEREVDNEEDFGKAILGMTPCAEYFPGGFMGLDREGNAIGLQMICKTNPKTLVRCDRVSELFKMILVECSLIYFIIRKKEEETGKKLGSKIIIDMEGFNMDLLYPATLKIYLNLIKLMQDCFPDFVKAIYVVNSPMMMSTVYNLVKPALAKQTQEKIRILGKEWKKIVCDDLGPENIYERWGGTKVPSNGKETGFLRMGGTAPEELRYSTEKNPHHIDEKNLTKISVSAKNKKEVKLNVEKSGAKLHWFFVASNDIDFSIQKDGTEVWPKFRLSTEFVPEFGHVECETPGEYVLIFDNSYGTFFSKDVKFHAHIKYE
ncbi:hypothetical protein FO519_006205 [Halicephalobus sp. NKZ332]|nr:hypothetical protein FO519_006205 [Halicephalobus sp. NKZ332]